MSDILLPRNDYVTINELSNHVSNQSSGIKFYNKDKPEYLLDDLFIKLIPSCGCDPNSMCSLKEIAQDLNNILVGRQNQKSSIYKNVINPLQRGI